MFAPMNEMERSSLDIGLFATGTLGFLVMAAGVIAGSIPAVVIGLLLMLLAVGYFALTGED
jgi:hypothetical protein